MKLKDNDPCLGINPILFLGSPCVDKLDELMGRGLHLSDIPIHDATRDVILVGEQAKAQDGLKKWWINKSNFRKNSTGPGRRERKNSGSSIPDFYDGSPAIVARASAGQKVWWCHHAVFRHCWSHRHMCPVYPHASHQHAEWTVHKIRPPMWIFGYL